MFLIKNKTDINETMKSTEKGSYVEGGNLFFFFGFLWLGSDEQNRMNLAATLSRWG